MDQKEITIIVGLILEIIILLQNLFQSFKDGHFESTCSVKGTPRPSIDEGQIGDL
jgi:hypothetical protein